MDNLQSVLFALVLLLLQFSNCCRALDCQSNLSKFARTIVVDQLGHGGFTSVQSAIDSIPEKNTQWIRVKISPGKYRQETPLTVKHIHIYMSQ